MARNYHTFDVVILGGGTAGVNALREALKYTDDVVMISGTDKGNTCAQVGCMPSKALIHAAELYASHRHMEENGIEGSSHLSPNIPKILKAVRDKRSHFVSQLDDSMEKYKPYIVHGRGHFENDTTIRVGSKIYHTKATVIATGSSPRIPTELGEFADRVITSDSLFEQQGLPDRIAVIGLGPVGLEIAQALGKLGKEILAIDNDDMVANLSDPDINSEALDVLREDMTLWMNAEIKAERRDDGRIRISNGKDHMDVDTLFVSTGRKPNTSGLGLQKIGMDLNGKGVPSYNHYTMKVPGFEIYMAGDVTDEHAVLHEAASEGRTAGFHAANKEGASGPRQTRLSIIFTKPNIAIVGSSYYALRHHDVVTGEVSFDNQGRAVIEHKNFGKLRIFADADDGLLRGAEIMAPGGEHLAHLLALAIDQRMTVEQVLDMPFYHPVLEEGLRTALQDAQSKLNSKTKKRKTA